MKKILFIVGSNRTQSFNLQIARCAEQLLKDKAEVSYLDYHDVPFINQDEEFPTPTAVADVRKAIAEADGLWVFSPEYNCSYPGIVKNLFDWLSRPTVAGDYTTTTIAGRKVTVSGIGGKFSTTKMQEKLVELLDFIGAKVMKEYAAALMVNDEAWVSNVLDISDEQQKALAAQAEAFLKFIG